MRSLFDTSDKPKLGLILGSGFSAEAELPTTRALSSVFLEPPPHGVLGPDLEGKVSGILNQFWKDIFGYRCGQTPPSLEDHFTVLDLSANSGHHLGKDYSPKVLRAIRRMSIHRVFQILDLKYRPSQILHGFLDRLSGSFDVVIITLNWDIVIEKLLEAQGIRYGIEVGKLEDSFERAKGLLVLKLHGSCNWVYCDSCRRLFAGAEKTALHKKAFLEKGDFDYFGVSEDIVARSLGSEDDRECPHCGNVMAGRVATFSYRKTFSINQFQEIWNRAHRHLTEADNWLFVGYSMPQADFEFRHLLKSAQLGRRDPGKWRSETVVKDDEEAANRYRAFFGKNRTAIYRQSLSDWVKTRMDDFVNERVAR